MPPKKSSKLDLQPLVTIPQLNLFKRENLQVSIENVFEEELLPTASWDSASEITFNIFGDPESFIDFSSLRLVINAKVLNVNGRPLPQGTRENAPIANFGCSIFEKVAVRLGHSTQISGLDSLYPYLTYLENIFKTSELNKKQLNFPYLLYPDSEVFFDRLDEDRNPGYTSRNRASMGSRTMFISVPIYSPITTQDKLMVPGVDLYIRMIRAQNAFLIMSTLKETVKVKRRRTIPATGTEPAKEVIEEVDEMVPVRLKINITSIKLLVRKYKLSPLLHMEIMNSLRFGPAIYPCKHQQLMEFSRVAGTSVIRETLFTDRILPKTVYLFILTTKRRLGDFVLNPWYMDWTELSEIKLVSGGETYPSIPYKPYRIALDVNELYMTMLRTTGSLEPGQSNGINMGKYLGGYSLIAFDLTRTYLPEQSKITDMPRVSDLQVHMDFRAPLEEATSFIFVLEFNSNIYVRSNADVTTDFL